MGIAVALLHHPVLSRKGDTSTTAITTMDVHDFARSCAFYHVSPVYLVHPSDAMHALVNDLTGHWREGEGGQRNPGRKQVLEAVRVCHDLSEVLADAPEDGAYQLWYTSANPPVAEMIDPCKLPEIKGNHLIVFGTGHGLDVDRLPKPNGWLSPIEGIGMVRHLSVRAALSIYLDRMCRKSLEA